VPNPFASTRPDVPPPAASIQATHFPTSSHLAPTLQATSILHASTQPTPRATSILHASAQPTSRATSILHASTQRDLTIQALAHLLDSPGLHTSHLCDFSLRIANLPIRQSSSPTGQFFRQISSSLLSSCRLAYPAQVSDRSALPSSVLSTNLLLLGSARVFPTFLFDPISTRLGPTFHLRNTAVRLDPTSQARSSPLTPNWAEGCSSRSNSGPGSIRAQRGTPPA
jgi:hypothetical protein